MDLLDGIDIDPLESVVDELSLPDVVISGGPIDFFSLSILTVPDVDRIGIPKRFCEDKTPVELTGLDEMSWGDVRRLIVPGLPDEQLQEIGNRERARAKPRAKVIEAVDHEWSDRGDGFLRWVDEMSRNPFACRVVAIAWRAGLDGSLESAHCMVPWSEKEMFVQLRHAWREWDSRMEVNGFPNLGGFSLDWMLKTLQVRACGVGLTDPFWEWQPYRSVGPADCEEAIQIVGGLAVAAQAIGVADIDIPSVPSGLDVWLAYRAGNAVQLADWCAGKLQLESELIGVLSR